LAEVPLLEIKGVSKSFGGIQALRNLDLTVSRGSIIGIIGPNGAGKTTLFNVITGHYKPDSGTIKFKGENVVGLPPYRICQKGLSRTYQIPRLFPELTIVENVMVASWSNAKNLDEALARANAVLDFVKFSGPRNALAKQVAVADAKRIELAKALATEPELLLLDETMAGLNPIETKEAINIIKEVSDRGVTVVLIEHVLRVVMSVCQYVYVLHEGRKLAEGSPQEIVNNHDVINAYLGEETCDA